MGQTVILGVIGSDAHVVGITILEQALTAAGFDVENLGVQTSKAEFVSAAETEDAGAVLVSSLYGHAEQDCRGLHERLADADCDAVTYIGGNLAVGQDDWAETESLFRELGFDRVFDAETDPESVVAALERDLDQRTTEPETDRVSVNS
ncbi:methylaspartate mutase subunit S [Halosimplex aquaticum]|uniref:Methylaspartate mutase subunit S n=1 Tax=Halosimplex aquaticum TaxID=3026162 RepID=A0ABD5Y6J5_9EURY|nr:methylaspartate mutase subunit S [Halosimplex aquaticum]